MADAPARIDDHPTLSGSQPLIGIPVGEGADETVRYFTSEEDADRYLARDPSGTERALSAIGAWSDLDFDDMLDQLDRIRHESKPTPPIDLDL